MIDNASIGQTGDILRAGGWTTLTAVNLCCSACCTTLFHHYLHDIQGNQKREMDDGFHLLPLALGFYHLFPHHTHLVLIHSL
jgi:hypothetical protein